MEAKLAPPKKRILMCFVAMLIAAFVLFFVGQEVMDGEIVSYHPTKIILSLDNAPFLFVLVSGAVLGASLFLFFAAMWAAVKAILELRKSD